ncbi:MAG: hypothetical protein KC447_03285 [Rhodobacteraceae bacterium]|nr:hypothetical protein [Paracoccaceae bacterium]
MSIFIPENTSRIPSISFAWSKDFSYAKYLEEKSHFDSLEIVLDRTTEAVIGQGESVQNSIRAMSSNVSNSIDSSLDRLGSVFCDGMEQLDNTTANGFATIEISLGDIGKTLTELVDVVGLGFDEVARAQYQTNEILGQLVTIAKHPEASRAQERFTYAKSAFIRGLKEESLEYINQAIGGDNHAPGFKLEGEFHLLRGQILLSSPELDPSFLEEAERSFKDAARYSYMENPKIEALAYQMQSWAMYCQGKRSEAVTAIERSVEVNSSDALTHFYASKFKSSLGHKLDDISLHIAEALSINPFLILRFKNDSDFKKIDAQIDLIAETILQNRREELAKNYNKSGLPSLEKSIAVISSLGINTGALDCSIKKCKKFLADCSLVEAMARSGRKDIIAHSLEKSMQKIRHEASDLIQQLNNEVWSIKNIEVEQPSDFFETSLFRCIFFGIPIGIFCITFYYFWEVLGVKSTTGHDKGPYIVISLIISGGSALILGGIIAFTSALIAEKFHHIHGWKVYFKNTLTLNERSEAKKNENAPAISKIRGFLSEIDLIEPKELKNW